ncbi:MAG: glycosyltransferase family 10 [Alphaproteobacteria bacterium]|nr:glycosyltransferase family 10 [Alphaproteobacteria bacterium]
MKRIKIDFCDGMTTDFFTDLLKTRYDVVRTDKPDYLFYSVFGNAHHRFGGIRIFWTGENVVPNFNYCDYAFGFHHLDFGDRYFRLPLWRLYGPALALAQEKHLRLSDTELLDRKFCSFVVSNTKQTDGKREELFERLSAYKPVASGGRYRNNVGGPVADKIAFQSGYKFALACENTYCPGYTTEKILDAFASGCVPVYYGDPLAARDFNPDAFISAHDFATTDALIEHIKKIDADDALYLRLMRAPVFKDGKMPDALTDDRILDFLSAIFDQPLESARRRFFVKPYLDVDYDAVKMRDAKGILKALCARSLRKLFKKTG